MSLDSFFEAPPVSNRPIKDIIRQRRAQMLIHSCIYYELNDNIISDHVWQDWADELERLQTAHPDQCKIGFFDQEFANWTGATGNHLNHRHPWVFNKANYILALHRRLKGDIIVT